MSDTEAIKKTVYKALEKYPDSTADEISAVTKQNRYDVLMALVLMCDARRVDRTAIKVCNISKTRRQAWEVSNVPS